MKTRPSTKILIVMWLALAAFAAWRQCNPAMECKCAENGVHK
jgi:hypothetical protein